MAVFDGKGHASLANRRDRRTDGGHLRRKENARGASGGAGVAGAGGRVGLGDRQSVRSLAPVKVQGVAVLRQNTVTADRLIERKGVTRRRRTALHRSRDGTPNQGRLPLEDVKGHGAPIHRRGRGHCGAQRCLASPKDGGRPRGRGRRVRRGDRQIGRPPARRKGAGRIEIIRDDDVGARVRPRWQGIAHARLTVRDQTVHQGADRVVLGIGQVEVDAAPIDRGGGGDGGAQAHRARGERRRRTRRRRGRGNRRRETSSRRNLGGTSAHRRGEGRKDRRNKVKDQGEQAKHYSRRAK